VVAPLHHEPSDGEHHQDHDGARVLADHADLDDEVTVSKAASRVPYALGLRAGERMAFGSCQLALVGSSNDAAYALAETSRGSIPAFSVLMNERAKELGMADPHFEPTRPRCIRHYSSATDIVTMTRAAMSNPEFRRIVALRSVTLPAYKGRDARKIKSTNELLGKYPGVIGVKTGFTDDAGYDVVTSAERDGVTLTAVVMGTRSNAARFRNSASCSISFKHLKIRPIAIATETVGAVAIADSPADKVEVRRAETTTAPVFDLDGPVARALRLPAQVDLPVFEGEPLGEVTLTQGERHLATLPLVASADLASVGETVGAVPVSDYLDTAVLVRASETSVAVSAFDPGAPVRRAVDLRKRFGTGCPGRTVG
jgi:D-alanyl-D-alanine carboxypeptidase